MATDFVEKMFADGPKTLKFAKVFSLARYTVVLRLCITGSLMTSKACGWTTEFIFVLFPLILPVVSMLQPLIYSNFGFGGFYCWVKSTNDLTFVVQTTRVQ